MITLNTDNVLDLVDILQKYMDRLKADYGKQSSLPAKGTIAGELKKVVDLLEILKGQLN